MHVFFKTALPTIAVILLASCASDPVVEAPPQVTSVLNEHVKQAVSKEDLEKIYTQLTTDLDGSVVETYPEEFAMLKDVSTRLSASLSSEVLDSLSEIKTKNENVSIPQLTELKKKSARINEVNPETGLAVSQAISKEETATNNKINKLKENISTLPESELRQKITALNTLYLLSGDESDKTKKDTLVSTIEAEIPATFDDEKVDEQLIEKLSILKEEQPENTTIKTKLAVVNSKLFKNRFFSALANDRPLQAYDHFLALTTAEDFDTIKSYLNDTGVTMAEYFTALGNEATKEDKLEDAYNWYTRSKNVQKNLQLKADNAATTLFIDKVSASYKKMMEQRDYELALGFLHVIKEFNPQHILLRTETRDTKKKVLQRALLQITTTAFTNSSGAHNFGNTVSAKITQYLFNKLPNDVRIIEREQYDAILREKELNQESGEERESLVSVDYIITGGVLEAKVDSQELNGKKTVRVVTGRQRSRNPEFEAWNALPEEARSEVEQPKPMIEEDVIEDVSIQLTQHRKVGIFSINYRLVDAASGKVILPNSVTFTEEYTDTSSEGVELGDFSLPFKLAELPSDLEILGTLANKAAKSVGQELVDKLQNPEVRYQKDGNQSAEEQNFYNASISFARALTLAEFKDQPTEGLIASLLESTVKAQSF